MADNTFADKEAGLVNISAFGSDAVSTEAPTPFEWEPEEERKARRKSVDHRGPVLHR